MRLVHARQQLDVGCRVPADEPVPPIAALLHHPALVVPPDQPRHLRPAQTGHLAQVLPQHSLGFARLPAVFLLHQGQRHPLVNLLPFACFKSEFFTGFQKRPDLFQAQPLSVFHADDQYPACGLTSPSGSFCVRNTACLQAHLALYKTLSLQKGEIVVNFTSKKGGSGSYAQIAEIYNGSGSYCTELCEWARRLLVRGNRSDPRLGLHRSFLVRPRPRNLFTH